MVISNDKYADLLHERPEYNDLINNRVVMFMFVGDHFMPAQDSNGRGAVHLDQLLLNPNYRYK